MTRKKKPEPEPEAPQTAPVDKEWAEKFGVDITKLKPNTIILLETENAVYEITVINKSKSRLGEVMIQGGSTVTKETQAALICSHWLDGKGKKRWIGKGMSIEFVYKDDKGELKRLETTAVKSARLYGPDTSWSLEVWEEVKNESASTSEAKQ